MAEEMEREDDRSCYFSCSLFLWTDGWLMYVMLTKDLFD